MEWWKQRTEPKNCSVLIAHGRSAKNTLPRSRSRPRALARRTISPWWEWHTRQGEGGCVSAQVRDGVILEEYERSGTGPVSFWESGEQREEPREAERGQLRL